MLTDGDDDKKPRKDRFLQSLVHDKAVNSAYFSHVDGTRLLTTDQHRYGINNVFLKSKTLVLTVSNIFAAN